mgnify:CR=1 FL=1
MSGGDDYLVKPFSYAELLARVKALLRRHLIYDKAGVEKQEQEETEEWIEWKNIRINTQTNIVYLNGSEISLTEIEYKILITSDEKFWKDILLFRICMKVYGMYHIYIHLEIQ